MLQGIHQFPGIAVRGTVAMGRAKVGANLVFARLSIEFSILGQPENI
jgi:hypothetical protein